MKTLKIIYIFFVLLLGAVIAKNLFRDQSPDFSKEMKSTEYFGVVTKKFQDPKSRYMYAIIVNEKKHIIYNKDLGEQISVGDTVLKKLGSHKHLLIKHGDTLIFYPQAYWKFFYDDK